MHTNEMFSAPEALIRKDYSVKPENILQNSSMDRTITLTKYMLEPARHISVVSDEYAEHDEGPKQLHEYQIDAGSTRIFLRTQIEKKEIETRLLKMPKRVGKGEYRRISVAEDGKTISRSFLARHLVNTHDESFTSAYGAWIAIPLTAMLAGIWGLTAGYTDAQSNGLWPHVYGIQIVTIALLWIYHRSSVFRVHLFYFTQALRQKTTKNKQNLSERERALILLGKSTNLKPNTPSLKFLTPDCRAAKKISSQIVEGRVSSVDYKFRRSYDNDHSAEVSIVLSFKLVTENGVTSNELIFDLNDELFFLSEGDSVRLLVVSHFGHTSIIHALNLADGYLYSAKHTTPFFFGPDLHTTPKENLLLRTFLEYMKVVSIAFAALSTFALICFYFFGLVVLFGYGYLDLLLAGALYASAAFSVAAVWALLRAVTHYVRAHSVSRALGLPRTSEYLSRHRYIFDRNRFLY